MVFNTMSFPPIIGKNPRILILGTLPSIQSIRLQQYYGNPQNTFWKILFTLFDETYSSNYNNKKSFAVDNNIAIWDVCHSAIREGSLDSAIKKEFPNKIDELLAANPTIKTIYFNGQKATKLYDKHFIRLENINYLTLLSTSPANARFSIKDKLENWQQIKSLNNPAPI